MGEVEDFVAERDYTGAIAYLEVIPLFSFSHELHHFLQFCRQSGKEVKDLDLWLAFAAFHAGDYQRASDVSPLHRELWKVCFECIQIGI